MDDNQVEKLIADLRQHCWRIDQMQTYLPPTRISDAIIARAYFLDKQQRKCREDLKNDNYRRNMYLNVCLGCIHRFECNLISYTHRSQKNVIVNCFGDEKEIIVLKQPLNCIDELVNVDIDHSRNYVDLLGDGCLYPKDENASNAKFIENMDNSARQSRDAFWGYALSNHWDYFITLTTDKQIVDRYDDTAVKRLWRLCRQRMQRYDKDVKLLLVPERHKRTNEYGQHALHFHGFVAMNKPFELKEYIENGELQRSRTGAPLFMFPFWKYGLGTCAIIHTVEDFVFKGEELAGITGSTSQRRIVAYLSKYMGKEYGNMGYGQRSFYRTQNVQAKEKAVEFWNEEKIFENTRLDPTMYEYKDSDKMTIFRTKFDGFDDEN